MESVWRRAWRDTERFRHTAGSFWGLEIVGASVLGLGGGYFGFLLTPMNATPTQSFLYPAIGGVVGVIVGLAIVFLGIYMWNLISAPYGQRDEARALVKQQGTPSENEVNGAIQIKEPYEDNVGECGLIISNSGSTNLVNCQAKLLDIVYETPSTELTLSRFPKAENLICDNVVAGLGNGKIPLFRWGKGTVSKSLEIVYRKGTEPIGYGVANVPILVLLNLWADGTQNTYAICKLEDRLGWGYQLSILKTGLQQDNPNLTTFQTTNLNR